MMMRLDDAENERWICHKYVNAFKGTFFMIFEAEQFNSAETNALWVGIHFCCTRGKKSNFVFKVSGILGNIVNSSDQIKYKIRQKPIICNLHHLELLIVKCWNFEIDVIIPNHFIGHDFASMIVIQCQPSSIRWWHVDRRSCK